MRRGMRGDFGVMGKGIARVHAIPWVSAVRERFRAGLDACTKRVVSVPDVDGQPGRAAGVAASAAKRANARQTVQDGPREHCETIAIVALIIAVIVLIQPR